jgi:RND family efflux transporter MFP subunit
MKPRLSAILLLSALALTGCKKSEAKPKGLPPATGEGAPPPAQLPVLEKNETPTAPSKSEGKTTGTTYAKEEAKIGPKASGVITKIHVKEGATVKKGAPLFTQDSRQMVLSRDQAAAAVRAAEINLSSTQIEYDRIKQLVASDAANRVQLEQVQARLEAQKVMLRQAKVGLDQANTMVADATVRAPIDGIVVDKLVSEGETATMMPPTIVLVIQDQSTLELRFRMPEKALAELKPGKKIKATFAAVGATKEAQVTRIGAAVDPMTRTVEIIAEIPNADGALKPGMLADVELVK